MAALDLRAAARRPRRGRTMSHWRRRITAVALLSSAVTALLAFTMPYPLALGLIFPLGPLSSAGTSFDEYEPLPPSPSLVRVKPNEPAVSTSNSVSSSSLFAPPQVLRNRIEPPPVVRKRSKRRRSKRREPPPVVRNVDLPARKSNPSDVKVPSLRREPAYWRMAPEEALRLAKREIQNPPVVLDDPDLYAPLFKNVSVFKRSYELMERMLKVYIYQDGPTPIFHTPELRGIYASEGWFMKLMEENRQYTTRDPSKAHLFYLPYSARQLELALYVPNSHNLRPLSLFLRDYVNGIAAMFPFWNKTRGADHFLVACHDWGPYTTTQHEELCKNTIKALCNSDASEGIFIRGRDVSLPETTIRDPKKPLRYVGGNRVSQRSILAFFAGNMHGRVRPILLKYWGDKDEDMRIYGPLPNRVSRQMSYVQHMKASKFCICPMGYEVNSPRIVESIYYECVPVIIADNFVLPFEELLDWSAFSVVVAEKDIPNLKNILLGISLRRYIRMHTCVQKLQKHFLWHAKPLKHDIFHMILHSIWFNRLNQIQLQQE
ncbi:probable glycosyltransferase At5g03795 [Musa acuminata AAA Group]|uniref:probable glycosyltransferase At5g03795 n=1 Tax=Musa acuminata AAA Group TaxID=214697 RepID=UPI0031E02CA2